ncbi:hypothetical protein GCM10010168_88430 [Actinoplanes ianthinogenes]|uniref:Uncharacterized protein n=1 Tax=Actinoplanes ianthinogenes TaxID=122358 RepID=A0ABN6C973_9ACTN|nr:hypothetical protein Aiant_26040 [Actinoplanes ianthinogenes]GGR55794.1 hypothetical protein GCM10010168_88430 [Actinoplanes ianthinogenes]
MQGLPSDDGSFFASWVTVTTVMGRFGARRGREVKSPEPVIELPGAQEAGNFLTCLTVNRVRAADRRW